MPLTLILTSIVIALVSWHLFTFLQTYNKARQIGLPILLSPVDPWGLFWMITGPLLSPILVRLPFGLGEFTRYVKNDWYYIDRTRLHEKLGPAFLIVSSSRIQVVMGDGVAAEDILTKGRKDFVKLPELYQALNTFGPNLDTVEGEMWQRHRKITVPPFNERNSNMVWRESLKQANGVLKSWVSSGNSGIAHLEPDMMTLALHVLTAAGFGKTYDFNPIETRESGIVKGRKMSFEHGLRTILSGFLGVILTDLLPFSSTSPFSNLLPKKAAAIQFAASEFRRNLTEMVQEERTLQQTKTSGSDNLMSALLRASDLHRGGSSSLKEDEIHGNLFIYSFAGHDTTANTMAYAITLLASDSRMQSWIKDEIEYVVGKESSSEGWEYENSFPQLKRCLALMYETLRLYGPVIVLPKSTGNSAAALTIQGKQYVFPPHADMMVNMVNVHHDPKFWPDPWVWRPERWIITNNGLGSEDLYQPPYGSFLPWAGGPRVCPGKKFSQVEFVAVIASLFQRHTALPVLKEGETMEEAQTGLREAVVDSECVMTLKMKHPEKARLRWELDA